jgi:hypothetical protein
MPPKRIEFYFDWGIDAVLWDSSGLISPRSLPLSETTIAKISELSDWHGTALNWGDPSSPLLWRQAEFDRFEMAAKTLYEQIKDELGDTVELVYSNSPYKEDPELDLYVNDIDEYDRRHGRTNNKRNTPKDK